VDRAVSGEPPLPLPKGLQHPVTRPCCFSVGIVGFNGFLLLFSNWADWETWYSPSFQSQPSSWKSLVIFPAGPPRRIFSVSCLSWVPEGYVPAPPLPFKVPTNFLLSFFSRFVKLLFPKVTSPEMLIFFKNLGCIPTAERCLSPFHKIVPSKTPVPPFPLP